MMLCSGKHGLQCIVSAMQRLPSKISAPSISPLFIFDFCVALPVPMHGILSNDNGRENTIDSHGVLGTHGDQYQRRGEEEIWHAYGKFESTGMWLFSE
jgi:hypothetical protein